MRPGEPSRARPAARSWIAAELLRPQVMSVMPGAALTLPITWTGRRPRGRRVATAGRRARDRVGGPPDDSAYRPPSPVPHRRVEDVTEVVVRHLARADHEQARLLE